MHVLVYISIELTSDYFITAS